MKTLAKIISSFLLALMIFTACQQDEDKPQVICDECEGLFSEKFYMWVDNELTKCPSNPSQLCIRVQMYEYESDTSWVPFEQDICGFDYEPGYIYKLQIQRKKIGTDENGEPIYKYCLLYIISKTLAPLK